MLTSEQLQQIVPSLSLDAARNYLPNLIKAMEWAKITTPARIGGFLAQCAHESGGFKVFTENLNYRAESLMKTWPNRFPTIAIASQYAHKPEKIANKVYANRMGNGDEASGDGWRYRGRGAIQCTGRDKYEALSSLFGIDFVDQPDLLATSEYAFYSAAWYWQQNHINALADAKDIRNMTKAVNGGLNGYEDRLEYYNRARRTLGF